ncbi:MAG TPA: TauD/TfdA family dioxygenase [Candidatus Binatia bacterium]|nr:TauD/TfdA family dioxygenase [Candidatus Binatia bacterium]
MPAHRSFGEQALHYFQRPHEALPTVPLTCPAAWKGPELDPNQWTEHWSDDEIRALEACAHALAGTPLSELTREHFVLTTLAPRLQRWRRELRDGRGFVFARGLPVQRWGQELASIAYWGIGLHLGIPGGQNPQGELLGHVRDYGEDAANPYVRKYRTPDDIAYHCDLADVVGLLCLATPKSGGASRIVSSVSVYNELLARRPDLVARLAEPMLLDTRDEAREKDMPFVPVQPCCFDGKTLRTFYHSDYFRSVVRHAQAPPRTAQEQELLDQYEKIARSRQLYLDMQFEAGDLQLISNHVILHARTSYEDWPEPQRRRHLLRLWLSLE